MVGSSYHIIYTSLKTFNNRNLYFIARSVPAQHYSVYIPVWNTNYDYFKLIILSYKLLFFHPEQFSANDELELLQAKHSPNFPVVS